MANVVRIRSRTYLALREIAERTGQSMQDVLDQAVEALRRRVMLEEANVAYAALRRNRARWRQELQERAAWDPALMDGLRND